MFYLEFLCFLYDQTNVGKLIFPLGLTGLISLLSKRLKSLASTTIRKHLFFSPLYGPTFTSLHDCRKKIQLRLYRSLSAKQCLWLLILTKFVIVIIPQSKCHLISWLYLMVHSDFGAQDNKICHCFHFFPFYLPWSDGIPAELSQILKDDAVKVLHSIHQKIWKTQQWPQDCKRSVFILIPKKGNAK